MNRRQNGEDYPTRGSERPVGDSGRFFGPDPGWRGAREGPRPQDDDQYNWGSHGARGSYDRDDRDFSRGNSVRYDHFQNEGFARDGNRFRGEYQDTDQRYSATGGYRSEPLFGQRGPNGEAAHGGSIYGRSNYGGYGYDRDYDQFAWRGQFTGQGPKGYKRSDERIQEDVSEALSNHGDIDARDIEVRVNNGEVILSGSVSDRRFKRLAEDLAERCPGVHDVRNEIRVQRENESGNENSGDNRSHQLKGKSAAGMGMGSSKVT